jgi:hypothetical protein
MKLVLGDLNPPTWTQQYPHVSDIRRPSVSFNAWCDKSGMYEIVCFGLKDIRVVESVIEVVADELQVVWLVWNTPGIVKVQISKTLRHA